mgnify:CR=1 FL=1
MKNDHSRLALLAIATLFSSCTEPKVRPYVDAPTPKGVLSGTVLYIGAPPLCSNGSPAGRVVLTLFEFSNPPAPWGTATSAVSLLAIPADKLFYRRA